MPSKRFALLIGTGFALILAMLLLAGVILRSQQHQEDTKAGNRNAMPVRPKNPPPEPLSQEPTPAPLGKPTNDPVSLIEKIDIEKDRVNGEWRTDSSTLVSPKVPFGRLQLPYSPPPEYDLTLVAERQSGIDSLNLGLVVGGRQCVVILDGMKDGDTTGVDTINGKGFMQNATTYKGKLLPQGMKVSIACAVRKNRLTLKVADTTVIDWPADWSKVSIFRGWEVPDKRALFIGTYESVFRLENLVVNPTGSAGYLLR